MKLQVMVSDEIVERIDRICALIGCSRSSVCAAIIVKSLPEWESDYLQQSPSEDFSEVEQLTINK